MCAGALALTLGGGPKLECYGTAWQLDEVRGATRYKELTHFDFYIHIPKTYFILDFLVNEARLIKPLFIFALL